MNIKDLIKKLSKYPDTMEITNEQNNEFIHIVNISDTVILSTTKPLGDCNRTGEYVYRSKVAGYAAFSPALDEDIFLFEYRPVTLLKEKKWE